MNAKKLIGKSAVYISLVAVVFFMLMRETSGAELMRAICVANIAVLIAGLFLMMLAVSCEGINLKQILKMQGYEKSLPSCLRYAFAGHYFTSVTPGASGGQPAQMYFMAKDGIPVGSSSVTLLIYNMSYHIGIIGGYALLFAFKGHLIGQMIGAFKMLLTLGLMLHALLLIFFICLIFRPEIVMRLGSLITCLLKKIKLIKNPEKMESILNRQVEYYRESAAYVRNHLSIFLCIQPVTLLQVAIIFSVPYFVFTAFGLAGFSLLDLLAVQSALTLVVDAVPLPGGVGISEAALAAVYKSVFGGGLLIPAVILSRLIGYYCPVLISGAATALLSLERRTPGPA